MHPYKIISRGAPLHDAGHAMILLHGRGGTPQDMLDLAQRFVDKDWHLAAPIAANSTWYPLSFLAPREKNEPWLGSAIDLVQKLIGEVNVHIPFDHIHLMGFSQGACLTTEVVARTPHSYGGVYAFTGGLIGDRIDPSKFEGDLGGAPIYLSNSADDPHVPLSRSKETLEVLTSLGAKVTLDVFPGRSHTIDPREIERVRELMAATA